MRLVERAGAPLGIGRKTRSIPTALPRALAARDRGCRFPACGATRFVDAHHIEHWAHGGPTGLANLVQLCRYHHRLLHEGGYSVRQTADGGLAFRRPDGRPMSTSPRPPAGRPEQILPRRAQGAIRHDACAPRSRGERLDLALGVDALLAFAPVRSVARSRAVGAALVASDAGSVVVSSAGPIATNLRRRNELRDALGPAEIDVSAETPRPLAVPLSTETPRPKAIDVSAETPRPLAVALSTETPWPMALDVSAETPSRDPEAEGAVAT